jgi:plasmid stabilization system protein ParE
VRRKLRFSEWALGQLEHALGALDDRRAARRLEERIARRLQGLKSTPRAGRRVPELDMDDLREVIVPPFRIVYRVERTEIRVLAVVHMGRELAPALRPKGPPR